MCRHFATGFVFVLAADLCHAASRLRGAKGPHQITEDDLVEKTGILARSSTTLVVIGNESLDEVRNLANQLHEALAARWTKGWEPVPPVVYLALGSGSSPEVKDDVEEDGVVDWRRLPYPNVGMFYGSNLARWYKQPDNFFAGCTPEPMNPELAKDAVAEWAASRALPTELADEAAVEEFQKKGDVVVVAFGLDRTYRDAYQIVLKLAQNRARSMIHFGKAEARRSRKLQDGQLILWNNMYTPPRRLEFNDWASGELAYSMLHWVKENADPPILNARSCNEDTWNKGSLHNQDGTSIATERHTLFLYFPPPSTQRPPVGIGSLKPLAQELEKQRVQMVWVDPDDVQFSGEMHDTYMIQRSELPAIRMEVVPRTPHGLYGHKPATRRYKCDFGSFAKDPARTVKECMSAYEKDQLTAVVKSEPEGEPIGGPVKYVVGSNFDKIVLQSHVDVMVLFCAPWCGHCKRFEPTFRELAKKVRGQRPWVMFAKMDVTRNDNPVFDFWKSPQLHLFPASAKEEPVYYDMHSNTSVPVLERFLLDTTLEAAPKDWKQEDEPPDDDDGIGEL